jgi:superfamily I DNA and/or RNA helicase
MSPLSVSQFLPADLAKMQFDVVVFDEASQLLPEDAIGAIYRGKQLVVTGDNQQLPPTTFFQQFADDGESEDDDAPPLFESILDACLGAGFSRQMLRWHYRSRHEHLIAFSNENYYDGKLITFPSPRLADPGQGVQFHHVPDGVYDRGGKRDNPREAAEVARLVLEHFRTRPELSLGVIAFSYAQMEAIQDELDRQLAQQPDLERFFDGGRLEGFFVKNLETVQGDERDVILLSVGYGRDAEGKIVLNFGPLNRDGGERRLNVAVTRARRQLIAVSSVRARDLNVTAGQARGLRHLQRYLDFAERGIEALRPADQTAPLPTTGLHEDVSAELKKLGYDAVPHIGCGAYRIDLGIVDPNEAGRFLLGIEFDGPSYAQASTARDRDRLRQEVLGKLGWRLHRVWAPDWLLRKQEEVQRLAAALSTAPDPRQ